MVEQCHPGATGPDGGQKWHTVPDLDDGIARAVSAREFRNNRPREYRVRPSSSYDAVSVAAILLGQTRSPGSPERYL